MDTLPREDVLPHLTSKVGPQLGRGGFGVEGGEEGVEVSKLGGAEEGTEDCRAGNAIEEIREVYTNTNPGVRGRVRVRVIKEEETLLKSLRWGRADAKVSTWPQGP